jgi:hypothetical protein
MYAAIVRAYADELISAVGPLPDDMEISPRVGCWSCVAGPTERAVKDALMRAKLSGVEGIRNPVIVKRPGTK